MDRDFLWKHIHQERAAMRETLAGLSPEQWEHESVCTGWTVKDVAAHVIANPQITWGQILAMAGRNLGRSYNTMVFRTVKHQSAAETAESILEDFTTYAEVRKKVPVTTTVEPMLDSLVHHQDILRPLGLHHEMAPDAAAVAADRTRALSFLFGADTRRFVKRTRMVATDIDWVRGKGPTIEAPMQELLLLCSGRGRVATDLSGDGRELLEVSSR